MQAVNFANFQMFGQQAIFTPIKRHRSRFTRIRINGYVLYMHAEDHERAHKGYVRSLNNPNQLIAVPNNNPRNPFNFPEHWLYGMRWVRRRLVGRALPTYFVGERNRFAHHLALF